MDTTRRTLVVTAAQYAEGYRRLALPPRWWEHPDAAVAGTRLPFVKIRDLADGTVLVEDPRD